MSCCGNKETRSRIRLLLFLLMTTIYFLVEVIVGHMTGSMALVADAFHMLSDIVALVIAYISIVVSPKKWNKNTYGFARAEVLGALSNAVFLVALCFSILVEALKKFFTPEVIDNPQLVLIVGCTGLGINLIGLFLFHEHGHSHGGGGGHGHSHGGSSHGHSHGSKKDGHSKGHGHSHEHHEKNGNVVTHASKDDLVKPSREKANHSQMNIRGVFLHVLGDALGSIVVIVSALVVWLSDWDHKEYVDPSLSIVIVIIIVSSTIPLLKESSLVLMQTVPDNYEVSELKENLLIAVPEILDIHEFHLWRLVGDRVISTLHVSLKPSTSSADQMLIARNIKNYFHAEGIHSTTVQIEMSNPPVTSLTSDLPDATKVPTDPPSYSASCMLMCPSKSGSVSTLSDDDDDSNPCAQSQCCGPPASQHHNTGNGSIESGTIRHRKPENNHNDHHHKIIFVTSSQTSEDVEANHNTKHDDSDAANHNKHTKF